MSEGLASRNLGRNSIWLGVWDRNRYDVTESKSDGFHIAKSFQTISDAGSYPIPDNFYFI